MSSVHAEPVTIAGEDGLRVSGLLQTPPGARACYVLAHGAGAGMDHPFMAAVAAELAPRGIATLRYQFPAMERGARRPDPPQVAQATVRAAAAAARRLLPDIPLIAGGKSFGGRMTSQAQASAPLQGVRGLAFLGFPLHPAGPAVAGPRQASLCRANPDAVSARNTRRAGDARSASAALRRAWRPRDAEAIPGRRSFLPRAGTDRPHGCAGARRNAGRARGLDRRPRHRPSASAMRPSVPTATRHHTNSAKPWRDT